MSDKFSVYPSCDAWAVKESGGYHLTPRLLLFNHPDDADAVAAVLNQRHPPSELRFSIEEWCEPAPFGTVVAYAVRDHAQKRIVAKFYGESARTDANSYAKWRSGEAEK